MKPFARHAFRDGADVEQEVHKRGIRGAYFVNASVDVLPGESEHWRIVADVEQSQAQVVALRNRLRDQGFTGLKLEMPSHPYDHDRYMPIYERAEQLGMPILFLDLDDAQSLAGGRAPLVVHRALELGMRIGQADLVLQGALGRGHVQRLGKSGPVGYDHVCQGGSHGTCGVE